MGVDFKAKQLEFTAYLRDPENKPAPADVKKQRMEMYRELFFNNIESFLADNFPVLKKILGDQQWPSLVQDFYSTHRSQSPYFAEIAEEFLDFLDNERSNLDDYPFMLELAHYEWVEMALSIAKDEVIGNIQNTESLLKKNIQLSPLAWPLAYQYPVQRISPEYLPLQAPEQSTFLLVHRDCNYEINFIEITPITYQLLQLIHSSTNILAEDCLKQIAQELNHNSPEIIITGGLEILKEPAEKSIILVSGSTTY